MFIRELRDKTGMTQREFANHFGIPLSTLCKWEQGESSPAPYVLKLIAKSLPSADSKLERIEGRSGESYYYDADKKIISDSKGNNIIISEDLHRIKEHNLSLYLTELFEDFYEIQEKFDRDCRYDQKEDIIWE